MKLGFIGLGNMAEAIIKGILSHSEETGYKPQDIYGVSKTEATAEWMMKEYGIIAHNVMSDRLKSCDIIFLAVKPQVLEGVLEDLVPNISKNCLIVSIVAGKSIDWLRQRLGQKTKIVRCMPNTPALVGEGCTGICSDENVTEKELNSVLTIFKSLGKAAVVQEKLMDAVVGVSGSSPAYVFIFIEALADAAVKNGMPRAMAYEFAAQSVLGSAKMVLETGKHPGELKDMVCSPGGTTIEAVKVLEEMGLRAAIMEAVDACVEKSKNL